MLRKISAAKGSGEIPRDSHPVVERTLTALLEQLNEMGITFPGTALTMRHSLLGSPAADP
ncbi:MAG: hypothetical protein NTW21_06990 [Verrucomicrobia bacterium]|nr:hypothetical protein [Verrucomicrobiota bacterium]